MYLLHKKRRRRRHKALSFERWYLYWVLYVYLYL